MMSSELDLAPILARHDLPQIVEAIQRQLEQEKSAREMFRRELSPSVKSEFIGGQIVMHSPAKAKHLRATRRLLVLIQAFIANSIGGEVFSEKALITLTRNDYEPDVCFFNAEKAATFDDDQMTFPAPDFVVEVLSDSTEKRDRGVKFDDYAENQVAEYWIVDCEQLTIEQYELRPGERTYHLRQKMVEGEIESMVISGFRIPVASVFNDTVQQSALKQLMRSG